MAAKPTQDDKPRRLNRVVGVAEALNKALDPALRKRGFASRDIITHWAAMAPTPYDQVAVPDRLSWPRGQRGADGATLYLRCLPGHALALSHEAPRIAAAINRYFGYVLVGAVRLSAEPLVPTEGAPSESRPAPDPAATARIEEQLGPVEDAGVKEALRQLGQAIIGKARK